MTGGRRVRDRRALSYASSFQGPVRQAFVRAVEEVTGKRAILRMVRAYDSADRPPGQGFWTATLAAQGITVTTPPGQIARIPRSGPVVVVANHPHGMVDGMVLAELVGRRRPDCKILVRSFLTSLDPEAAAHTIPVPFPDQPDAQAGMLEMRRAALAHLTQGGAVALFPSGVVASSASLFGPAVEADWNVFTAKLIRLSRAAVVPCYFPGANSRAYLMANRVSAVLRQSLLLHEVARTRGSVMSPVIGAAIPFGTLDRRLQDPRRLMSWLRRRTLDLGA